MNRDREQPLQDEAAKRREWRGDDGEAARPEADGHTLPASEDERMKEGGGSDGAAGPLTTIPPPD